MKVILISGKARSGKDMVAGMIEDELRHLGVPDNKILITHFADLLKHICKQFFKWDGTKDEYGRWLLQYVGTDVIRARKPNMWVGFIKEMLNIFYDNWDYVIVPDCRFPNEVTEIQDEFDSIYIRIETDRDNNLTEEQKNHPSETSMDNMLADVYISNNASLSNLREQVDKIVERNIHGGR